MIALGPAGKAQRNGWPSRKSVYYENWLSSSDPPRRGHCGYRESVRAGRKRDAHPPRLRIRPPHGTERSQPSGRDVRNCAITAGLFNNSETRAFLCRFFMQTIEVRAPRLILKSPGPPPAAAIPSHLPHARRRSPESPQSSSLNFPRRGDTPPGSFGAWAAPLDAAGWRGPSSGRDVTVGPGRRPGLTPPTHGSRESPATTTSPLTSRPASRTCQCRRARCLPCSSSPAGSHASWPARRSRSYGRPSPAR